MVSTKCVYVHVSRSSARSLAVTIVLSGGILSVDCLRFAGRGCPPPNMGEIWEQETRSRLANFGNMLFLFRLRHICVRICIMFPGTKFCFVAFVCYIGTV
jgi:hypothetical protein